MFFNSLSPTWQSEAFLKDLEPYMKTGKSIVVRHIFLRVFVAAVARGIKLPTALVRSCLC